MTAKGNYRRQFQEAWPNADAPPAKSRKSERSRAADLMSALPPIADVVHCGGNVRFVP
jgi:hypothetical protein